MVALNQNGALTTQSEQKVMDMIGIYQSRSFWPKTPPVILRYCILKDT